MSLPIYHITHIDNLASILKSGGMMANSSLNKQKIKYFDISYENIQIRRANTPVPCSAGGVLHDYVPFYFAPRSPMLYTIEKGNVPKYQEGQNSVIYLVADVKIIVDNGLKYAFTDGHPVMNYSDFYDVLESVIDWELMNSRYWNNSTDDPNRKCRRQAEFLVYQFCPLEIITKIGVMNQTLKLTVEKILQKFNITKIIEIQETWYYK